MACLVWHEAPGNSSVRRPTTCGYCGLDLERSGDASEESGAVWLLEMLVHRHRQLVAFERAAARMPRLIEPGPMGIVNVYEIGTQAGDANLFSLFIAHIATASSPHPLHTVERKKTTGETIRACCQPQACAQSSHLPPRDGQSWRRRVQTKGASPPNTSPKRTQPASWSLLTSRQRSRSCAGATCTSSADLATVFSRWYTGSTTHRMHYDGSYAHI